MDVSMNIYRHTDLYNWYLSVNLIIWYVWEIGDDCIAINENFSYVDITGIIYGPGHGIRYS